MKEIQQDEDLIVEGIEKLSLFLMKNVDKVFNILWKEYEGQMIKTEFEDLFRKEYMKYEQLN